MGTATVQLEIDADSANIFRDASNADKIKLCALWGLLLRDYKACPTPLRQLMDDIGEKARARGLTADKLESILNAAPHPRLAPPR